MLLCFSSQPVMAVDSKGVFYLATTILISVICPILLVSAECVSSATFLVTEIQSSLQSKCFPFAF
jgi:hypothetical protein